MNMNDKDIFEDFVYARNLSKASMAIYKFTFRLYTEFTGMNLKELLNEAEMDENNGVKWKERKLRQKLIKFRRFLYENYAERTAKINFARIKTFYMHYEIEIFKLPTISNKNTINIAPVTYKDLPTKDIIRKALEISKPFMKAIILFMSSSGCARQETMNLTIKDFLNATYDYHKTYDIGKAITIMDSKDDVVPTWKLRRQKTNKFYLTFSSPESTNAIINYLISLKSNLNLEDKLFKTNTYYFSNYFVEINEKLGLGKVGVYNRFRSHVLRKFHASQLYNDGMQMEYIDSLQGRVKKETQSSYFMEDPDKLKQMYMEHMHALLINTEVNTLDVKSEEFKKMEAENQYLNEVIENRLNALEQSRNIPIMHRYGVEGG